MFPSESLDHWLQDIPEPPNDESDALLEYLADLSDYELQLQYVEMKGDKDNG